MTSLRNKKVLLRERKRHTVRRVASARYADLYPVPCLGGYPFPCPRGYPVPCLGGTPSHIWGGTPFHVWGVPHPRSGGYPVPCPGVPHPRSGGYPVPCSEGYPIPGLGGTHPRSGGTPSQVQGGTHPRLGGTPSQVKGGTPLTRPVMGYPAPPSQTWDGVPPTIQTWMGYPPRNVNRQTPVKTVPSRHTTYVGGNYVLTTFSCKQIPTNDCILK